MHYEFRIHKFDVSLTNIDCLCATNDTNVFMALLIIYFAKQKESKNQMRGNAVFPIKKENTHTAAQKDDDEFERINVFTNQNH